MADYRITFARSARKELQALDAAIVSRIFAKIEALASQDRDRLSVSNYAAKIIYGV